MGSCVYHVAHQTLRQSMRNMGQNVELANYTQALYDARELAMERMQAEALEAKAEGIVGVDLHERSPRLGQPRDRVLRDRDGDHPGGGRRGSRDRGAADGARPLVSAAARARAGRWRSRAAAARSRPGRRPRRRHASTRRGTRSRRPVRHGRDGGLS